MVRLVGGHDGSHGRVEITADGTNYTVCDDHWGTEEAIVVCRSMGYAGGQVSQVLSCGHCGKLIPLHLLKIYGSFTLCSQLKHF